LNVKLEADFFVESDGIAKILPVEEQTVCEAEVKNLKLRKGIVLRQVGSLFEDEVTSDVKVSVVDKENVELGQFFCHSMILSGNCNEANTCNKLSLSLQIEWR